MLGLNGLILAFNCLVLDIDFYFEILDLGGISIGNVQYLIVGKRRREAGRLLGIERSGVEWQRIY